MGDKRGDKDAFDKDKEWNFICGMTSARKDRRKKSVEVIYWGGWQKQNVSGFREYHKGMMIMMMVTGDIQYILQRIKGRNGQKKKKIKGEW